MTLIENWRDWWKFYSTHANAAGYAIIGGLAFLKTQFPEQFALIPAWAFPVMALAALICFIIARIVKQAKPDAPDDSNAAG
jgi:hypothetical protein